MEPCAIFTVEYGGREDLDNCFSLSFFGDINTPPPPPPHDSLSASPSASEHQLRQHPNAIATVSCDTGCRWGFPPSQASKDGSPVITRTPLRLNNICQINPPNH